MRTIEIKVYTVEDHPDVEKCYEWIRNNWYDINQHSVHEVIDSIKELKKHIGGTFEYSISQVPDRGEYIIFKDFDRESLLNLKADDCPLTGLCWDTYIIEELQSKVQVDGARGRVYLQRVLDAIHEVTECQYSDEGLNELCVAEEYEFTEDGTFCSI